MTENSSTSTTSSVTMHHPFGDEKDRTTCTGSNTSNKIKRMIQVEDDIQLPWVEKYRPQR
jgi:hypothetical protein